MENSNNTPQDFELDNKQPGPNADPGAEIETVIPGAEKEEAQPESSGKPAEAAPENTNEPDENGDAEGGEQKDKPEITEVEKDEPEISENEGGESTTDEHGVETISP